MLRHMDRKKQAQPMKTAKKIQAGRAGVESRLYLVLGYHSTTQVSDETGEPAPFDKLRIAADNLSDLMKHLERWERDFDVREIRLVGLVITISGTPYWG